MYFAFFVANVPPYFLFFGATPMTPRFRLVFFRWRDDHDVSGSVAQWLHIFVRFFSGDASGTVGTGWLSSRFNGMMTPLRRWFQELVGWWLAPADVRWFSPGWWFGCHEFYFPIYWVANHPNWLIFFREVETTKQILSGTSKIYENVSDRCTDLGTPGYPRVVFRLSLRQFLPRLEIPYEDMMN